MVLLDWILRGIIIAGLAVPALWGAMIVWSVLFKSWCVWWNWWRDFYCELADRWDLIPLKTWKSWFVSREAE